MRPSTLRPASREVTTESPASIVTLSSARHGPRSSFLNTYVARRSTSYGSLVVDVQIRPPPKRWITVTEPARPSRIPWRRARCRWKPSKTRTCTPSTARASARSHKASMAYDLEHGRRLELDWLSGKVRALGRTLGIPTPASDAVYTVLKLHRLGIAG